MSNPTYALVNYLALESALPIDAALLRVLEQAALLLQGELQQFASDTAFGDKMQVASGSWVNCQLYSRGYSYL